jgi:hypothetical protein
MAPLLHQWYSVSSLVILDADEYGFAFACDEDVYFLEYFDALLCETKTMPSSKVLPTLIRNVGKSWNVSACINRADSLQKGS